MDPTPRQTSGLAVASLVGGILGWTLMPILGSLVGIVCGHMARGEIRRNPQLDGDGMAVAGLVLGWVSIAMSVLALLAILFIFGGLALLLGAIGLAHA